MLNNYSIAFIICAIIAGGIIFYLKIKNTSDPEQSSYNIFDIIFNSKNTPEEAESSSENESPQEKNIVEKVVVDNALDIFNKSKEELNDIVTILPFPLEKKKPIVSFGTKHKYFIDSLDDSIKYCKNNNKFKHLYYLIKYKNTYQELHTHLLNKDDYDNFQYNSLITQYTRILDNLNQKLSN